MLCSACLVAIYSGFVLKSALLSGPLDVEDGAGGGSV